MRHKTSFEAKKKSEVSFIEIESLPGQRPYSLDMYSGDLISELVWYSNGPKQFVPQMICYSSHVVNSKLIVCYLNGKNFCNQMAIGYQTFYRGR